MPIKKLANCEDMSNSQNCKRTEILEKTQIDKINLMIVTQNQLNGNQCTKNFFIHFEFLHNCTGIYNECLMTFKRKEREN